MDTFDPAAVEVLQHPGKCCPTCKAGESLHGAKSILAANRQATQQRKTPLTSFVCVASATALDKPCFLMPVPPLTSRCVAVLMSRPHTLNDPTLAAAVALTGAHFVPTCSGAYKQQLVEFLDRFKGDVGSKAAAAGQPGLTSASVGSSLESLGEQEPEDEAAEGMGLPEAAAVGAQ